MILSSKLEKIQPSTTLAITSKAKAMAASGEDVIILAAGEPDFDTPEVIKEAAIKAIKEGFTKYTPASGMKELKEAVCHKLLVDNGLEYDNSEIVISCGAKHSIYNVLQAICNSGDEVIIISPYWLSYPEMVKLADAKPVILKTKIENSFRATAEEVKSSITSKTKAIILNCPSNPAGVVYGKDELGEIAEVCLEGGITVISDEIYEKILFDNKKHFSIASISSDMRSSTIVINGVSKSYSMTGWRIGYMAGDKNVAKMVSTLQSQSTSNPTSISQAAALCALTSDLEREMKGNCLEFQKRRDLLMNMLKGEDKLEPFKPEGAFYLFCNISGCKMDSMTFSKKLLDEKKVAVIPGGPFGEDSFIRISFATDVETIEKGIKRIKEWVK